VTAPAPLDAARREAEKAMAEYETLCPMGVRTGSRFYAALRSLLAALSADKRLEEKECEPGVICPTCVRLEKAEETLRTARVTANDHAREVIDRYFIIKATTQWLPSGSDMADRFGGDE
jgi:hypothetical protein